MKQSLLKDIMTPIRVLVSGAAGNIGYAILPMIVGFDNSLNI